jgi:Yip1 domain
MNALWRAIAILIDPFAEWKRIEQESGDPAYLMSRYVALLACVPAVFGFIGACIVGVVVPGSGEVERASLTDGLFGAVFGYAAAFASVFLLGLIINAFAPAFGGRRDFASALKLAVYSHTPVWLAGIFLILPGLRFLTLAGFYGAYIAMAGLPLLMKSPEQRSLPYTAVITACAVALVLAAAAAEHGMFGLSGI